MSWTSFWLGITDFILLFKVWSFVISSLLARVWILGSWTTAAWMNSCNICNRGFWCPCNLRKILPCLTRRLSSHQVSLFSIDLSCGKLRRIHILSPLYSCCLPSEFWVNWNSHSLTVLSCKLSRCWRKDTSPQWMLRFSIGFMGLHKPWSISAGRDTRPLGCWNFQLSVLVLGLLSVWIYCDKDLCHFLTWRPKSPWDQPETKNMKWTGNTPWVSCHWAER